MMEGITNTTRGQGDVLPSSRGGKETEVKEDGGRGEQRSRRADVKEVRSCWSQRQRSQAVIVVEAHVTSIYELSSLQVPDELYIRVRYRVRR